MRIARSSGRVRAVAVNGPDQSQIPDAPDGGACPEATGSRGESPSLLDGTEIAPTGCNPDPGSIHEAGSSTRVARGPREPALVTLRVAVVGCAAVGAKRAHTLRALGVDALTFADDDAERARQLHASVGGAVADSVSQAAANSDAVIICSPPQSRVRLALEAIRAGAHVFVEAPLGDNVAGVGVLLEQAGARNRALMVGSRFRFHPAVERIRMLLEARTLGRVYAVSMWIGTGAPTFGDYPGSPLETPADGDYGLVVQSMPWLDVLRWLFGRPMDVTAVGASVYPDGVAPNGVCAAIVRFESEAILQLYTDAFLGCDATRLEVVATAGTLHWSAGKGQITLERWQDSERRVEHVPADAATLEEAEMRHFLACVLTGRSPISNGAEGRATLMLALAVQRACRLRRMLPLPESGRRWRTRRSLSTSLRLVHAT